MKKNIKKATVMVMAVGFLLVGGLGAVAYASGNSYENFKEAVVDTMNVENLSVSTSMQMKQNGTVIAENETLMQKAGTDHYSLSNITIGDEQFETERSSKDGAMIYREGDQYYSTNYGFMMGHQHMNPSSNMVILMETAMDLFIGDIKNQFVEHGNTISVDLTDAQIPELANVALAAAMEMNDRFGKNHPYMAWNRDINMNQVFPIEDNAKIENIHVKATIKNGLITKMDMNLVMTGQDQDGNTVSVETTMNSNIDKLETTTTKQIDTTGKTVTEQNFENGYGR